MSGIAYDQTYFNTYPGYDGDLVVSGSVKMEFVGTMVNIGMELSGVDAACANGYYIAILS